VGKKAGCKIRILSISGKGSIAFDCVERNLSTVKGD
jgi:hypothetical protein